MTLFKSHGMQLLHAYSLGNIIKRESIKIAYFIPEDRILKEHLSILHDTKKTLVLFSEKTKNNI